MDLSKIIAVSGRPGLYKINTQTRDVVVATSLIDGKRITANASVQISVLGEIQVYCIGKETPLLDVFVKIPSPFIADMMNASIEPVWL